MFSCNSKNQAARRVVRDVPQYWFFNKSSAISVVIFFDPDIFLQCFTAYANSFLLFVILVRWIPNSTSNCMKSIKYLYSLESFSIIPCFRRSSRLFLRFEARVSKSWHPTYIPLPKCFIFLDHSRSMSIQISYSISLSLIREHKYFSYKISLLKSCSFASSRYHSSSLNTNGPLSIFCDMILVRDSLSLIY